MVAVLPVGCWVALAGAGQQSALLPGTWQPVEVGMVRREAGDDAKWAEPELLVALDWQPEQGQSLGELPPAEYSRVLKAAFYIFSRTRETSPTRETCHPKASQNLVFDRTCCRMLRPKQRVLAFREACFL